MRNSLHILLVLVLYSVSAAEDGKISLIKSVKATDGYDALITSYYNFNSGKLLIYKEPCELRVYDVFTRKLDKSLTGRKDLKIDHDFISIGYDNHLYYFYGLDKISIVNEVNFEVVKSFDHSIRLRSVQFCGEFLVCYDDIDKKTTVYHISEKGIKKHSSFSRIRCPRVVDSKTIEFYEEITGGLRNSHKKLVEDKIVKSQDISKFSLAKEFTYLHNLAVLANEDKKLKLFEYNSNKKEWLTIFSTLASQYKKIIACDEGYLSVDYFERTITCFTGAESCCYKIPEDFTGRIVKLYMRSPKEILIISDEYEILIVR